MNIEPDIFDYLQTTSLEPHDDYTSEITYKDQKIIWTRLQYQDKEIERLNNIINEFNKLIENEINESKLEEDYDRVDVMEYCLATLREIKGEDKE